MKIIKRNGQEVQFDNLKIKNAIEKANANMERAESKLSEEQIANALETGLKDNLGEKMPPHGLYLYKVEY